MSYLKKEILRFVKEYRLIKKNFFVNIVFLILLITCSFSCNNTYTNNSTYNYLTKADVEKDCKELDKYLRNAYILYDDNIELHPELENLGKNVIVNLYKNNRSSNNSKITVDDFQKTITSELKKSISIPDSHLHVFTSGDNSLTRTDMLFPHKNVYFTEVLFTEVDGQFCIIDSPIPEIKNGDIYTGRIDNVFPVIKDGKSCLQYGVVTPNKIKMCTISVNNQNYQIKVIQKKNDYNENKNENVKIRGNNIFISNVDFYFPEKIISSFPIPEDDIYKYNVILDLRNNSGGYTDACIDYINQLLFGNTEYEKLKIWNKQCMNENKALLSPVTWKASYNLAKDLRLPEQRLRKLKGMELFFKIFNIKRITTDTISEKDKNVKLEFSKSYYPKKIIILMNRETASAAELLIADFYALANNRVITIGENSAGCVNFMGTYSYYLPKSKIGIRLSSIDERSIKQLDNPKFKGEQTGFYPDYWFPSDDEELINNFINNITEE